VAVSRSDRDAFFLTHVDYVWRSLLHLGVPEADLQDQTHEVFLVAFRRFAAWDGEHARGWLFAIARRCASAYRRRGHRRHEFSVEHLPETGVEADPSLRLDAERLDRALAALDDDKRTVFVLFEIEDMTMREVAKTVGCQVATAYARLYAARRELAHILSEGK
jgi:RNA polymerase sigma-70 factor, ECF subfamily